MDLLLRGPGPVVVLYSAEVPVDGSAELTPLFLSLFTRSACVQRLYCTRWSTPSPPSAVVLTQPERLMCPACYRAYPSASAASTCDLCGTPLAANPLSAQPGACDPALLAQAQADLRTPGVAVLLVGQPEDPTLSAILAARDPAVTPLVAVGASLEEEEQQQGGAAVLRIPGSVAEGVQAVAAALGLSEGLARALAAAQAEAEAEAARAAGAAAAALPPTPGLPAAEEASVQHAIQAALAAAASSDPCSMQALQALAAGGRPQETEEDAKFFSPSCAEEAEQAAPHAEAAPAFFYTEEEGEGEGEGKGEGEGESESNTSGDNSQVE
jgi:hypothetical protein